MKKWPESGKPVPFEELVDSVRQCISHHYRLFRKNTHVPINYKGYDIGSGSKATCLSPDEALTLNMLEYDLKEQGRDALDVIIGIAIQLGIEQGRRIEHENTVWQRIMLDLLMNKDGELPLQ